MKSKVLNILKKVMSGLAFVVALFAVAFTIFTVVSIKQRQSVFGYQFYVVLSDSMSATDFSAGDMIVVKEVDVNTLKEGDIITFVSMDEKSRNEVITHKIREVVKTDDGQLLGFRTYGTTTNTDDEALAEPLYVLGQYQFNIPKLGYFIESIKTDRTYSFLFYMLGIALPFAIIIGSEVYRCVKIINENKKEKERIETEERNKLLEEERLKNEQMQREIEELKRMLESGKKDSEEE